MRNLLMLLSIGVKQKYIKSVINNSSLSMYVENGNETAYGKVFCCENLDKHA